MSNEKYMLKAIALSKESIKNGGGPFGAVIVKDDKIISATANSVTNTNDPTAHAEINAIRKACKELNTFDLSDCVIYTSCEPCPMCLGAIYWARIDKVYYANTKADANGIGFDDSFIYSEIEKPLDKRKLKFEQILRDSAIDVFKEWDNMNEKTEY
jgi:tRNA(Arg) A34 adenosine deaminase TadA